MTDGIRLDGRIAVVTGAAGVIGTETIKLLAARGARIVAVDRDAAALQRAVAELPASAEALALTADVTSEEDVIGYVAATVKRFGTIDIFYNNAGIEGTITPIVKMSLTDFRRVLDVNVVGVFLGMKHVLPVMLKANKGLDHQHRVHRRRDRLGRSRRLQRQQTRSDRPHQERGAGMHRHQCTRELRLSRPDRQPHAVGHRGRTRRPRGARPCGEGRRSRAAAPARPRPGSRPDRGLPRLR